MPRQRWDIFCTVIDNFGDIGVTWRLARQLAAEHALDITLWVDDLASFARIAPALDSTSPDQRLGDIRVRHWGKPFCSDFESADVVIEAFACELPASYQQAMATRTHKPVWLNLEYLSAEDWVAGCHGMASPHPRLPLTKYFFFPGFDEHSGGLLCEAGLLAARDSWQADRTAQDAYWLARGIPPCPAGGLRISLFAYDTAAAAQWSATLAAGTQAVQLLVPQGRVLPDVLAGIGITQPAQPGDSFRHGALEVCVLPMTDQDGYDRLLWSCDLNIVRGEDSFVRAQWAGRPFVWHIYRQEQDAHLEKLDAFLQRYLAAMPDIAANLIRDFHHGWNRDQLPAAAWPSLLATLPLWQTHASRWPQQQLAHGDLATNLVQFTKKQLQ
ncbi:elongation factor P maturation arginine rhamnosyltransferase EarP [Vogesella oryzae]|uniref:elongation factor P maturation arginine rhamnosyltransferase EarP n=1 Tax=Vogesella oryzae TaxID=1735285 RepID=UPI001581EA05|nr:elongation factor P maturation arginine rhamnosyltransferase EarP [Vogesella oryzae]